MMYGGYGGFGLLGGLGMIFYLLIFIAIIWAAFSFLGRGCRRHDHDSRVSDNDYDSRISRLERNQDENKKLLNQILRKLD